MNAIENLHKLGQSIWYDNIERKLLRNGEMEKMISLGEIRGVTSNPSIFQKAIANSGDYDSAIQPLAWSGWNSEDIFFQLAIEDIREACDLFTPLYNQTHGGDGYVSLEVNPKLAYDSEGTYQQVIEIWNRVNRKNLMVKIPATVEGLPAIRKSTAAGVNVNITLIFSVKRYEQVVEAYLSGLEDRLEKQLPIDSIASVASFFVSRVDTKVDKELEKLFQDEKISKANFESLRGKAGIANSRLAFELFEEKFSSERFKNLAKKKAKKQRPLWASTSTKNPDYYDVIYVEELIGENTVNTMPPKTLEAFKDHGKAEIRIKNNLKDAQELFGKLDKVGISMDAVTQSLEDEGVLSFEKAFISLLETIEERKNNFQNNLVGLQKEVKISVETADQNHLINRIYEKDPTVWTENPNEFKEIQNRLGWLDAPIFAREKISEINTLRDEVIGAGFSHVLLLGMGGSSLASEVLSLSFRGVVDGLDLSILDSTDPRQVKDAENKNPLEKTLFVVASKSGGTTEVQALMKYFYNRLQSILGDQAGKNFVAITDPGTHLSDQAHEMNFRKIIYADPTVGGRFSALTSFGLLPAGLIGIELDTFIDKTIEFSSTCRPGIPTGRNPGLVLGVILAEAAKKGIDKLTIIAEEPFRSFGSWLEQLIAESSGKNGKGIIPIDIEPFVDSKHYSNDRLFIYVKNDGIFENKIKELVARRSPVITFDLNDPYDLGSEFFRWEIAIAVACSIMGINVFNQPDVQDNKNRTKQRIDEFLASGEFKFEEPLVSTDAFAIYSPNLHLDVSGKKLKEIVGLFLDSKESGDYVAINAYLPRFKTIETQLQDFRKYVLNKTNLATTLGFGPRFLHSTGQLHKGGPNSGLIIQIVNKTKEKINIPGMGISFGDLIFAQGIGDYEVLVNRNRRILRIELSGASIDDLWK